MKLLVEIFMSELSRVRYLLRAYLRVRLQKIERHVMHILDNAGAGCRVDVAAGPARAARRVAAVQERDVCHLPARRRLPAWPLAPVSPTPPQTLRRGCRTRRHSLRATTLCSSVRT